MHRFFIKPEDKISGKQFEVTSPELVHQWSRVLRFQPGEQVVLLDGSDKEYIATISEITKKNSVGIINESRDGKGEPSYTLMLAQALLKSTDKVEWVLQKGTELGVSKFVPLSNGSY
jgi:16S rRNA (uracil1498-N3)-methyltransferase